MYATPVVASGSGLAVLMVGILAAAWIVKTLLVLWSVLSMTWTVKEDCPAAAVVAEPVSSPEELRVRPVGSVPLVICQM